MLVVKHEHIVPNTHDLDTNVTSDRVNDELILLWWVNQNVKYMRN